MRPCLASSDYDATLDSNFSCGLSIIRRLPHYCLVTSAQIFSILDIRTLIARFTMINIYNCHDICSSYDCRPCDSITVVSDNNVNRYDSCYSYANEESHDPWHQEFTKDTQYYLFSDVCNKFWLIPLMCILCRTVEHCDVAW